MNSTFGLFTVLMILFFAVIEAIGKRDRAAIMLLAGLAAVGAFAFMTR